MGAPGLPDRQRGIPALPPRRATGLATTPFDVARAAAMIVRDTTAQRHALTDRDWKAIGDSLRVSWRALAARVAPGPSAAR